MDSWESFIGKQFGPEGRYVIRRRIGEGGMGVVFEAWEELKQRSVAIKVLRGESSSDPEILQRFKREGSRFAKLKHPNIVRVYGMGRGDGLLYIASEFIDGTNLYDIMDKGNRPLEIDRALAICSDVASGLAVAHENGVIHRDLKPENVMITRVDQVVKILDFGIAKDLNASVALTVKGTYIGTPAFSSPEQIRGEEIDARSDIFSLGVILYEMVTGEAPFKGKRSTEILNNTIKVDPINPSRINDEISAPVARLIAQMIAKKPRQRPASCHEVLDRIREVRAALAAGLSEEDRRGVIGFLKNIFKGE